MKTFIWRNGRPEAQSGYNDDLVMAFGIAMYIRDTALKFRQRGIELTKQSLNNMSRGNTNYVAGYQNNPNFKNPYEIKTKDGKENIDWLL